MKKIAPVLLVLATLLTQLSSGINYITIPVLMNEQGYGNSLIGFAMSFEILGVLLLYRPISIYLTRIGLLPSLFILFVLRFSSLMLMAYASTYFIWIIGIFSYGLATGMTLVLMQTWLNIIVQGKIKGLIMGLYSSALSGGVALGPIIIQSFSLQMDWRFEICACITILPIIICLALTGQQGAMEEAGEVRIKFALRHAKIILLSALIGGISFFGLPSFLTLYGLENGLAESQSQLLLTMFMVGSLSLGIIMSTTASLLNRITIVLICIFGSVVCAVYLSLAIYTEYWLTLILLFLWGGCMGGIYSIGLTVMGERFYPQDQMSANMSYTIMDSLGGVIGLLVIGIMMDWLGPEGMTSVIITSSCALLVFYVYELLALKPTFE